MSKIHFSNFERNLEESLKFIDWILQFLAAYCSKFTYYFDCLPDPTPSLFPPLTAITCCGCFHKPHSHTPLKFILGYLKTMEDLL